MILNSDEYYARFDDPDHAFDKDMAQTVADWWYGPYDDALTALATAGKVLPTLEKETEALYQYADEQFPGNTTLRAQITALLDWAKTQH